MIRRTLSFALLAGTLLLGFGARSGHAALVDYVGYGYETGTLFPSMAGDQLEVLTVGTQIDPVFGAGAGDEITVHLYGLVSTGEFVDPGTGFTTIVYTGGMLDLYADPSGNADWGVFPPNATAPSSFADGNLLFSGAFTSFTLFLAPNGAGAYEGTLDGVGGSALGTVCANCAYSFSGVFTRDAGAQILDGYDIQVDGTLDVDSTVPVAQPESWGSVKSLFQD